MNSGISLSLKAKALMILHMKAIVLLSLLLPFISKLSATVFTTTSSLGSSIFTSLWGIILSLFKDIATAFGSLIGEVFSGFGQSIVMMFQSFGFSMSSYGVWAPLAFVVGLGLAIMVGYLFFTFIDAEKDVTGVEDDL